MNNDSGHSDNKDAFRDSIATIDSSGKRVWMFPSMPKGKYYDYRKYLSYLYLVLFFGIPFIEINDSPLFLINILERKFVFVWSNVLAAGFLCVWNRHDNIYCVHRLVYSNLPPCVVAGHVPKPYSWKCYSAELSFGLMEMQVIKNY